MPRAAVCTESRLISRPWSEIEGERFIFGAYVDRIRQLFKACNARRQKPTMQRHKLRFCPLYATAQTVSLSTTSGYYFDLSIVPPCTRRYPKALEYRLLGYECVASARACAGRMVSDSRESVKRGFGASIFKTQSAVRCLFHRFPRPAIGQDNSHLNESAECIALPVRDLPHPTL